MAFDRPGKFEVNINAWILVCLGLPIAAANFYLSFVAYPLHRMRGRHSETFQHSSGIPVIGTLFLAAAAWLFPDAGSTIGFWCACVGFVLDTGGPQWFPLSALWQVVKHVARREQ